MLDMGYIDAITGVEELVLLGDKPSERGDGISKDGKGWCCHAGSVA
jgi:hypothetical protein